MSEFTEIEREEIAVQFVRVPDGLDEIRRAWNELEAVVPLLGRHFYGAYDPVADDYRACVELREGDELVPGLAVVRAVRDAEDPEAAARKLRDALDR